jgi:hypothetical protein
MSGIVTELGEVSIIGCVPAAAGAFGLAEANLNGQLAISGGMKASLDVGPPSVALAGQIGAELSAQVMASVTAPYFGAAIAVDVNAIALIQAQLRIIVALIASLGTMGVFLYKYSGTADSFGTAMQSVVGPGLPGGFPSDHVDALALIASTPAAWAAMQNLFKTS